ncbi:cytochrome bd-I oxidase subunit CydX [Candidatus Fukatsuia symbiotica]|uniref:Cytochrome bd-I oxidase subunit CydX n=1 Tax=Candidatus Fukatsuia symbiotica TaxID=1878942 RepID=A0A2U8I6B5_9GAMM|nr:cytochrome bd-I oxidase subunit CydX [Candidatus Fukatsuia symbiotica]AWK14700.1 cytochrome bd-I oxidase subunit CydX [Candidatus Fukatsuia symbiotica]MEA9445027.1 cytochrome bd-I oxidase subunit CydX [Candidatus Fukatsuia symbiotica]
MWYLAWIFGTLLACCFGIISALALEQSEISKTRKNAAKNDNDEANL